MIRFATLKPRLFPEGSRHTEKHFLRFFTHMPTYLINRKLLILLTLLMSTTGFSASNKRNYAESIENTAVEALTEKAEHLKALLKGDSYEISIAKLPSDLRLSECQTALTTSFLTGDKVGAQRLRVRCSSPNWSMFVRGNIDLFIPVLVSRRTLEKGEVLGKADLIFKQKNISKLRRGYLSSLSQLENREASKRIDAGDVITPSMLQTAHVVKRGNRVTLTASSAGFVITMPGEAMEDGELDQQIRVRNLSSGKIIRGIVSGKAEVIVP